MEDRLAYLEKSLEDKSNECIFLSEESQVIFLWKNLNLKTVKWESKYWYLNGLNKSVCQMFGVQAMIRIPDT